LALVGERGPNVIVFLPVMCVINFALSGGLVFEVGIVENCCSLVWIVLFSIFVFCLDPEVGSAFRL
jgi:hypothetical protein